MMETRLRRDSAPVSGARLLFEPRVDAVTSLRVHSCNTHCTGVCQQLNSWGKIHVRRLDSTHAEQTITATLVKEAELLLVRLELCNVAVQHRRTFGHLRRPPRQRPMRSDSDYRPGKTLFGCNTRYFWHT